jgi:stage IV sporulation protein FB
MIFAEPPRSQGDIYFRLFGFPIRIHWTFWLVTLMLSISTSERTPPAEVAIWAVAVTISIIIHELGHAFLQRHYGGRPRIVLYGMGGLAICDDCNRSSRSQILIALAGPFAGFKFAILLLILMRVTGQGVGLFLGQEPLFVTGPLANATGFELFGLSLFCESLGNPHANELLLNFLWINILWGLVNLLPIYPLDGGQVSREVCQIGNPRGGIILSLQISVATAVGMAVFGLLFWNSLYTALMFGYLAYMSFQILQSYRQSLW